MNDENIEWVRSFLKRFKKIASRSGIYFVPRDINLLSLAELGLAKKNAKDIILTLSVNDYCKGPLKDKNRAGDVWVFGKRVMDSDIYMKLKLAMVANKSGKRKEMAKCISFHIASHPLVFPLRDKLGGRP